MAPCLRQRGSIVGGIITIVPSVGLLPTSAICGPTRCSSGRAREWLQLGGYPAHRATTPLTPVGHAADSRGLAQCGATVCCTLLNGLLQTRTLTAKTQPLV